jgi:hypothetical protein
MAATVTTKELVGLDTSQQRIDEEIRLRIKAGAIKCWTETGQSFITIFTEWNVIGEQ